MAGTAETRRERDSGRPAGGDRNDPAVRARAQAYTLEALIGAVVLLTAVLLVTQSVVITPTTAGTLDRDAGAQLRDEASDVLVTAGHDGELGELVRYFNDSPRQGFAGDWDEDAGYGTLPVDRFDDTLSATFDEGVRYNVEVAYRTNEGGRETAVLRFEGTPGDEGVIATHTVTLTEGMHLTGPGGNGTTLGECDPGDEAGEAADECDLLIPNANPQSPVYNVVEVRVIVW